MPFRFNLVQGLQLTRAYDRAMAELRVILTREPANFLAWDLAGDIARAQGDADGARAAWNRARQADPTATGPALKLASLEIEQSHFDAALALLDPIATAAAANEQVYDLWCQALTGLGDWRALRATAASWVGGHPESARCPAMPRSEPSSSWGSGFVLRVIRTPAEGRVMPVATVRGHSRSTGGPCHAHQRSHDPRRQARLTHGHLQRAAQRMEAEDFGSLPVGENDRLVGMLSDRDIAIRAVAQGLSPTECTVRDVMSDEVKYVFDDQTVEEAARMMGTLQVRRLPVLNRDKRLVGIVSLGDLASPRPSPPAMR